MSKGLKITFLLHTIACLIIGGAMFLVPAQFLALVSWPTPDPGLTQLYGAALLALGISSWLGYKATHPEEVRILVEMEIAFTVIGSVAALYQALRPGAPAFLWIILAIWVPFAVAWGYFYRHLAVEPTTAFGGQRPLSR